MKASDNEPTVRLLMAADLLHARQMCPPEEFDCITCKIDEALAQVMWDAGRQWHEDIDPIVQLADLILESAK